MPLEGGKGNVLLPMANKHHGLVGGMGMVRGKGLFWGKVVQYQHAHVMRGRGRRRLWGGKRGDKPTEQL